VRFKIFANLYKDSVSLMQLGAKLRERQGVSEASCIMATPANLAQLADAGLAIEADASPSDLLVVVSGEQSACDEAIEAAGLLLRSSTASEGSAGEFHPPLSSLALGIDRAAEADLALISVPGDYAAAEAMKALTLDLHVMLFSDNVSIAEERTIKRYARDRDLIVMGPDCGTAIVNGVPLGFANVVRRGDIGLVAASGTGLQEVTCGIHHGGGGVSQALGTGGRDLHDEIGGITMLQGLAALAADARTRVIVLISKPPAKDVASKILELARTAGKPVVVHFLGASPAEIQVAGLHACESLQHAAEVAVALSAGRAPPPKSTAPDVRKRSAIHHLARGMTHTQHAARGLYTGGTFCYEAQQLFIERGLQVRSNAPVPRAQRLEGERQGHIFIDMGDDDYTRGRPHPMIDPALRNEAIRTHAADAEVAAIVFDVVLGYGAHADPAAGLAAVLTESQRTASAQGRTIALIGHVCGTEGDPQQRDTQVAKIEAAGALVAGSNFQAISLAADLVGHLAAR
jgi:succinyl-CoA synthetase alpha subunit